MDKICGIYKITSPSKKVYIGQSLNVLLRFRYYKRMACEKQTFLYHSLKKHGVDKHNFEIIHVCEPDQLDELEIYYIELYSCFNSKYGLNLRTGGSNGSMSEITKEKLRIAALNRPPISEATRNKMCEYQRNRPPMSAETRLSHSVSAMGKNKGRKQSKETCEKKRLLGLDRKHSLESRKLMTEKQRGNKNNLGKKHSPETIIKMKEKAQLRMKHPSMSSYNRRGCRCAECRKIGADYRLRKQIKL